MRQAVIPRYGTPDVFQIRDAPDPTPGAGEVRIRVRAAGINFADVLIRNGHYPQPPQLPVILGNEVAGDIGGRPVLAFVRGTGGGYAEQVVADDEWIFDLPAGEIEMGIGIHGEPGRRREALGTAAQVADVMVEAVVSDLGAASGAKVLPFVNGMGGTPLLELYLLYGEIERGLKAHGLERSAISSDSAGKISMTSPRTRKVPR